MAFLSVVLLALFTLAIVRALGARATLSNRTFFVFLVAGALIGPPSLQAAYRFFDPYNAWGDSFGRNFVIYLANHAILLLPVYAYFFRKGVNRVASVADAFLLGFCTGFGYDLLCTAVAAAGATQRLQQLTAFPPFTFDAGSFTLPGYAYWSALTAVAVAFALRFLRSRTVAFAIGGAVLVFFAAEHTALLRPAETSGHWFALLTIRGMLTPYLALLALVVCSFLEYQWVHRQAKTDGPKKLQVLSELQVLLNAMIGFRFKDAHLLARRMRLERNAEIAAAETAAGKDETLARAESYFKEKLATLAATPASKPDNLVDLLKTWVKERAVQVAVAVGFLGVLFVLPMLPNVVAEWFWKSQLFQFPLPGLNLSILNTALIALIIWRYLAAPARPFSTYDPDELMDFSGESGVLKLALGCALVTLLYGPVDEIFNFNGSVPWHASISFPGLTREQMITEMLLLAACATGLALERTHAWERVPMAVRRASAIHNALVLLLSAGAIWAALVFFGQTQAFIHQKGGAWLFNHFGASGNSFGDVVGALVTGGFTYAVTAVLLMTLRKAEGFLIGAPATAVVKGRAATAGAGR